VQLVTTSLQNARVNVAYQQTIAISDGTWPYLFAVSAGLLPNDLRLNVDTGLISGTPRRAGTSTFTIRVTDDDTPPNEATREFTLTVE
jgi:hypothetical protein